MEPRIQYAKTEDGVNIAYYTMGEGEPLIVGPPLGLSHLTLEWADPLVRRWLEHLAESRLVVRYDPRCYGLSDRRVQARNLAEQATDIAAVIEKLGLDESDLLYFAAPCRPALAYAAKHPGRVRKLVLIWPPTTRTYAEGLQAVFSLIDQDFDLFLETYAHTIMGWASGRPAHAFAQFMAASQNKEDWAYLLKVGRTMDVEPFLEDVTAETLVIDRTGTTATFDFSEGARDLTASLANARLVQLDIERASLVGSPAVLDAIDEFLGIADAAHEERTFPSGMAIILFVDIANSTGLTEQLGDQGFRERARRLDEVLAPAIRDAGGAVVEGKLLGDGLLATFSSAREALGAAQSCRSASKEVGLELHLGIHAGDIIREDDNIFGGAVNIAARIADASAPGEILVSDTLRGVARTSAGVNFEDRGEHELKGIPEPQRLFAVRE